MNVILVHGFLDTGAIFSGLARHLTLAGHTCFVPSLKPSNARDGIPMLAYQLDRFVHASLPANQNAAFVGFSMGAIVVRYYLQELDGHKLAKGFFSICGPHCGTLTACLCPGKGVSQMRPNSRFLKELDQTADRLAGFPVVHYWTPFDLMVRPVRSSRWCRAENVRILSPLHSMMVSNRSLHNDIERRLSML